jgi:hypothetical protein
MATFTTRLSTREYRLDQINEAVGDLLGSRIRGRGVLIP